MPSELVKGKRQPGEQIGTPSEYALTGMGWLFEQEFPPQTMDDVNLAWDRTESAELAEVLDNLQAQEALEEDDDRRYPEESDHATAMFDIWLDWQNAQEARDEDDEFV